jgi:hypothetical protein
MNDREREAEMLRGVSSLLGLGSSERTFRLWFDLLSGRKGLRLWPCGLMHMVCSRDWTDCQDEDLSEIVDAEVRHGKLTNEEVKGYAYKIDPVELPDAWFIHFEGHMALTIVCLDIVVEEFDLGIRYPHIAEFYARQ